MLDIYKTNKQNIIKTIYNLEEYLETQHMNPYSSNFESLDLAKDYAHEYLALLKDKEQAYTDGRRARQSFELTILPDKNLSPESINHLIKKILKVMGCKNKQKFIVFSDVSTFTYKVLVFSRYVLKTKKKEVIGLTSIVRDHLNYNKPNSGIFTKQIQVIKSIIRSWKDTPKKSSKIVKQLESQNLKKLGREILIEEHDTIKTKYEAITNDREQYQKVLHNYNSLVKNNLYELCMVWK